MRRAEVETIQGKRLESTEGREARRGPRYRTTGGTAGKEQAGEQTITKYSRGDEGTTQETDQGEMDSSMARDEGSQETGDRIADRRTWGPIKDIQKGKAKIIGSELLVPSNFGLGDQKFSTLTLKSLYDDNGVFLQKTKMEEKFEININFLSYINLKQVLNKSILQQDGQNDEHKLGVFLY